MSEVSAELQAEGEALEQGSVAQWASFQQLTRLDESLKVLTSQPWAVHEDPATKGRFYISGPPETEIVAEGLTQNNALVLVNIINSLPEVVENYADLAKLWDALADGVVDSPQDSDIFIEVVRKYQMRIAQLEGNPSPIPEASTASDLSFMHVGHYLEVYGMSEPIGSVFHDENGAFIRVTMGNSNIVVYLDPQTAVKVHTVGPWQDGTAATSTEEEIAVLPTVVSD